MAPRRLSRFTLATAVPDAEGTLILHGAEPYRYRKLDDTRIHVVGAGDALWTIAARYYRSAFPRPSGLWWVIADFQPEPIHDPTLRLELGRQIHVPSARTVLEEILSERRRDREV